MVLVKISALPGGADLIESDFLPAVQTGTTTQVTTANIRAAIAGRSAVLPSAVTHTIHVLVGHATNPDGLYWSDGANWFQA